MVPENRSGDLDENVGNQDVSVPVAVAERVAS